MAQQFETQGPVEAFVRLSSGEVVVTPSADGTASAEVRPLDPQHEPSVGLADRAEVRFDHGRLVVVVPQQARRFRRGEVLVTLALPTSSRLAVKGAAVRITVEGGLVELDARIGRGSVVGDAVSRLLVRAGQVDVQVDAADVVTVATGGGSLRAEHVRDAAFRTGNGSVHLGRTDGHVVVKGGAVDVAVGEAVSGDIVVTTGSGGVQVLVARGTTVDLDLISGSGDVRCDLPMESSPPGGGAGLRLRLKTGHGDLQVAPMAAA